MKNLTNIFIHRLGKQGSYSPSSQEEMQTPLQKYTPITDTNNPASDHVTDTGEMKNLLPNPLLTNTAVEKKHLFSEETAL